ncbi:hypothetical protein RRG08_001318 [Elysia crispata]|uniref:Secreted protein n=1 Tax=Elysia crispata TaxID=231223 RepID=A0AAE1AZW7_9GAST|nr:hypothetical protein RRG08_001318 [Elysia crispata]
MKGTDVMAACLLLRVVVAAVKQAENNQLLSKRDQEEDVHGIQKRLFFSKKKNRKYRKNINRAIIAYRVASLLGR